MAASGFDANEVRPKLWVGSKEAAAQLKALAGRRISYVLSVGAEFPASLGLAALDENHVQERTVKERSSNGQRYLRNGGRLDPFVRLILDVSDVDSEDIARHFDESRLFISEGMAQGGILVHCSQGLSRSVALTMSYLMRLEKINVAAALLAVREHRPAAGPRAAFVEQLRQLESRFKIAPASPKTAEKAGTLPLEDGVEVNPQVFLEVALNGKPAGRLVIELFMDVVPRTAENFRCLCTGERGRGASGHRLTFLGSVFHLVVPEFGCIGGDITQGSGTGGESIYGYKFDDENFDVKHDRPGIFSMANSGPNTNGSQFVILTRPAPQLDGKNVAFGKVLQGHEVVERMEACSGEDGRPTKRITIVDCGEVEQRGRPVKRMKASAGSIVHVMHILRKHQGCKKATSWKGEAVTCNQEEAQRYLEGLRKKLEGLEAAELRKRFEELASAESHCKTAKKSGDYGPIERGLTQRSFEDACFGLEVGRLSDIVSTKHGEHLILRIA